MKGNGKTESRSNDFGKERQETDKVILSLPMVKNDAIHSAGFDIVEPIMTAMAGYHMI